MTAVCAHDLPDPTVLRKRPDEHTMRDARMADGCLSLSPFHQPIDSGSRVKSSAGVIENQSAGAVFHDANETVRI